MDKTMSPDINFNQNWSYYHCTTTDYNDIDSLIITGALNDSDWHPLVLPHVPSNAEETAIDSDLEKWWYRKQFEFILSDQQWKESILLTFKSLRNDSKRTGDSITSSIFATVWLDTIKIFSGSMEESQISMDLSEILLNSDQVKTDNQKHTLVVCCMNRRLSLNAVLTVPYGLVNNISNLKYRVPLLTIVMLIVGTRGDVQPFIPYAKALCAAGHRVRLATHEKFRKFVRDNGLEYFPLSSDPNEIMSFMVENSGIIPSMNAILKGDLIRRRRIFFDILKSTWLACTSDDDETGASFQAEAIIANPISYGHVHCAQKLGIPLHMVFTMPASPTSAFPHPLSTVNYSKIPREHLNIFSYSLVDAVMWLGIGDLINEFRCTILDLPSMGLRQGTSLMIDEKVPYSYCWSPLLVSKPSDWPHYIDVSGYFFLDLATSYKTPPDGLLRFLGLSSELNGQRNETSMPIFIGFGSVTTHDSKRLLKIVLDALKQTGYRAVLSGFDTDADDLPETIFKIDDVPYDWLFQHVSAVCHHGGAGTTATGLRVGKPTIVVPFFGDQFFWGSVVERSGAGPSPLPRKDLTVEGLVEALKFVHTPAVQNAAKCVQEAIRCEDGCRAAVHAFHANLPSSQMQSDLESTFAACFRLDQYNLQISRPVAQVLLSAGLIDESQLRCHSTRLWLVTHDTRMGQNDIIDSHCCRSSKNDSNDISILAHNASNISGFSPEVCKRILFDFTEVKRQHVQISTNSHIQYHRSYLSTVQRYQWFCSLLTLPILLSDIVRRFLAVFLDALLCDKNPHSCNRFRIVSWLFSRCY